MAIKKYIPIFSVLGLALLFPNTAHASSFLRVCTATGNCGLCDIVAQAITLGKWLITGAGGLALLIIVFAAFRMVSSAGNPEMISGAKKQIVGALLGVAIVFAAFQLVVIIISMFATPAQYASFETATSTDTDNNVARQGNLKRFLGIAWWDVCNENELREKNGAALDNKNSTADCKYWGDGTACSEIDKINNDGFVKMCFNGKCAKTEADLPSELKTIKNPCDFLATVDKTYQESEAGDSNPHTKYSCTPRNDCYEAVTIEEGLCPTANTANDNKDGKNPTVCCAKAKK